MMTWEKLIGDILRNSGVFLHDLSMHSNDGKSDEGTLNDVKKKFIEEVIKYTFKKLLSKSSTKHNPPDFDLSISDIH